MIGAVALIVVAAATVAILLYNSPSKAAQLPQISFVGEGFSTTDVGPGNGVSFEFTVNASQPLQLRVFLTDESFYTGAQVGHNSSVQPDFVRNITSMTVSVAGSGGPYNVTQSPYTDARGDNLFTNATGTPATSVQQGATQVLCNLRIPSDTPEGQYLIGIEVIGYSPSSSEVNGETGSLVYGLTVNVG